MKRLDHYWYSSGPISFALWPLSWVYCGASKFRSRLHKASQGRTLVKVPIVVVGNITVGGTGKTPMVIWLANFLKAYGYKPGVVSRGYGGKSTHWPQHVSHNSNAGIVGDEPLLIVQRTGCPVYVGPHRVKAINQMLKENGEINIIISDDGLQHYKMPRDVEIAMVDGHRRFGNQLCLPAGPLRESVGRLKKVDFQIVTEAEADDDIDASYSMRLEGNELVNLRNAKKRKLLSEFKGQSVHAVAGIGNPMRFFTKLSTSGLKLIMHAFPDHHRFQAQDFRYEQHLPIIMTEKDAVKCKHLATDNFWYLPVKARLGHEFAGAFIKKLREKTGG